MCWLIISKLNRIKTTPEQYMFAYYYYYYCLMTCCGSSIQPWSGRRYKYINGKTYKLIVKGRPIL